jgi:AraC-like DNA-binding protein
MDPRVRQILKKLEETEFSFIQRTSQNGLNKKSRLEVEYLNLEQLALSVNLSVTRFRSLFKTHTGRTPNQYVREMKMRRAREMAATTHLKINEILSLLQVGDESHFHREFKKHYGISLTQYRRQLHTNLEAAISANE